jgi:methionine sulfoxide reductase catalytic subunit
MAEPSVSLEFPFWIIITHFFNLIFITFLMRSGLQILSDHPRLYWNDDCTPGSHWLRCTKKEIPCSGYYTSMEECVQFPSCLALPGGKHLLGLGRNIHFFCASLWVLNGFTYIALLFLTGQWPRLIPTSWEILPKAIETFFAYLTFHIPPLNEYKPYDPLQQISYAAIVFLVAPLQIATGLAMSPALSSRFPWYHRLFGGHQGARSLHFLLFCMFVLFMLIHISMVALVRFPLNIAHMVLGSDSHQGLAIVIAAIGIGVVVFLHFFITKICFLNPRLVQKVTCGIVTPLSRLLFSTLRSRQTYPRQAASPYFWCNGPFCKNLEWELLERKQFTDWKLKVNGRVEMPLELSLHDLKSMPKSVQCTKHRCIQGWSGIAEWGGVQVAELLKRCHPLPEAQYLVTVSFQTDENGIPYYEAIELDAAHDTQTILAYEMNGEPLSLEHGAPLRLRIETKLGYKMTKWIRSVVLVSDLKEIGLGYGGYHEDYEYYERRAEI